MKEVTAIYKANKAQFIEDMRTFKDSEIRLEEEIIERTIKEGWKEGKSEV